MWVEFGNKFHEVCDEFHERSEWNSRKRVKFISEFHEQGVDSYIITWITKNEKFTLFTGNYWIWETFLRSYAWDRGDLRNFPPRSNISPKLRNSLEKWRMGLRLTPKIFWRCFSSKTLIFNTSETFPIQPAKDKKLLPEVFSSST